MAFQLYLWYLLLRRVPTQYLIILPILLCIIIAFSSNLHVSYMRHNSIGWMPEFVFGMLAARINDTRLQLSRTKKIALFISAFIGLILFAYVRYTFVLSGLCFVVLLLLCRRYLAYSKFICFVGSISASIYVVHAIVRHILWSLTEYLSDSLYLVAALVVLAISILCSIPYQWVYNQVCKRLLR